MVLGNSSSLISEVLGCNIYSLKTSAEEKLTILRSTSIIETCFTGLPTFRKGHHTAVVRVDQDCFITK